MDSEDKDIADFVQWYRDGELSLSDLENYLQEYVEKEEYEMCIAVREALKIINNEP